MAAPVGDGIADDTRAVQDILNGGGGLPVALSPGTYRLTSALTVPRGLTLNGYGATLLASAGVAHRLIVGSDVSDVTLNGVTLDLNRANVTSPSSSFGTEACGVFVTASAGDVGRIVLRDVTVRNGYQFGIYARAAVGRSLDVTLENVTSVGNNIGAYVQRGDKVRISGGTYDANAADGLYLDGGSGHRVRAIRANGNGRHGAVVDTAACDFTLTGCVCNGNGTGSGEGAGIVTSVGTHHWTIAANVCRGNKTSGIQIDPNDGTAKMISAYGTLTGNVAAGSTQFHGIYVTSARFVTVTGNVCQGNKHSGVMLACSEAAVSGNQLVENVNSGLYLAYTAGKTPNMGAHVIGPNLYSGNGTPITTGSSALTASRSLDA